MTCRFTFTQRVLPQGVKFPYFTHLTCVCIYAISSICNGLRVVFARWPPSRVLSRTSRESKHHRHSVSDTRVPRYQLHHKNDKCDFSTSMWMWTPDGISTGLIAFCTQVLFEYIWNCWEKMTLCANPHNGLRMRWIHILCNVLHVGIFLGNAGWESKQKGV